MITSSHEFAKQHISFEFGLEATIDNLKHSWGFRPNNWMSNHEQLGEQRDILSAIIAERDRQWVEHILSGGKS